MAKPVSKKKITQKKEPKKSLKLVKPKIASVKTKKQAVKTTAKINILKPKKKLKEVQSELDKKKSVNKKDTTVFKKKIEKKKEIERTFLPPPIKTVEEPKEYKMIRAETNKLLKMKTKQNTARHTFNELNLCIPCSFISFFPLIAMHFGFFNISFIHCGNFIILVSNIFFSHAY